MMLEFHFFYYDYYHDHDDYDDYEDDDGDVDYYYNKTAWVKHK